MGGSIMENILNEIDSKKSIWLKLLLSITRIPSPTGKEKTRETFLKKYLNTLGFKSAKTDSIGNCVLKIDSKTKDAKTILIVAHADTACDPGDKVLVKENKRYIYAHGACDNGAGLTGVIASLEIVKKYNLTFKNNLIIAFTVGEEGLGAKRGMKKIIKDFRKNIDAVINVEVTTLVELQINLLDNSVQRLQLIRN